MNYEFRKYSSLLLIFVLCVLSALCWKSTLLAQSNSDTIRISMKTTSGMQYDLVRFSVKPGTYIKLVLTNADEMEHNLVIGQKESRQNIVDAALALGKEGPASSYIPKIDAVLFSIPLLQGGQSDSILFRAPRSTGVYPYVCTFPGHGGIMYGAMHVTNGVMPELLADIDIPPHRRKAESISTQNRSSGHPFELIPPYLYRVLMPEAGPAAIAVCLPHKISYCWDAGACRLRYVWSGEFLDLTDYWTIKGELHAKILGSIFYRDPTTFPLRFGESNSAMPVIQFKGYRLLKGYPEFHYTINGIDIFELIQSKEDGSGLIRTFSIPQSNQSLIFHHEANDGMNYDANKGKWSGNQLTLLPGEAKSFSITMSKKVQ